MVYCLRSTAYSPPNKAKLSFFDPLAVICCYCAAAFAVCSSLCVEEDEIANALDVDGNWPALNDDYFSMIDSQLAKLLVTSVLGAIIYFFESYPCLVCPYFLVSNLFFSELSEYRTIACLNVYIDL